MKRNLRYFTILTLLLTTLSFFKAQSQPKIPVIQVTDTLCNLSCGRVGTATGIKFLPDGNSFMVAWEGRPLIIDTYSGKIIRQLDSLPNSDVSHPMISKDGTKLFATRMGPMLEVWDIASGKIIKMFDNIISRFCLSPDGTKFYCSKWNDESNPGVIEEFDINTFECTATFCNNGFLSASDIAISPDGQTLAVEVFKNPENESDQKTTQVILIDLNDKSKHTVIETLEPSVYTMAFSPNGKNLAFAYVAESPNIYTCVYNIEKKENKFIFKSEMENLLGSGSTFGNPIFLNDTILLLSSSPSDLTWSLDDGKFKKIIDFNAIFADVNGNKLILCGHLGDLAILDFGFISGIDNENSMKNSVSYNNNSLEFNSEKNFTGDLQVFNLEGKMVLDLNYQSFTNGKNIIALDQSLPAGVYIVVINNGSEQISRKFVKF